MIASRLFYSMALLAPVAGWLEWTHAGPVPIFVASCLAILPLAGLMGEATEQIAHRVGPGLGGLMNATFGNAAELIIGFIALRAGELEIVKASITGSILGNLLMVLGLAMLVGGWTRKELRFNRLAAETAGSMMLLSVVALVIPAIYAWVKGWSLRAVDADAHQPVLDSGGVPGIPRERPDKALTVLQSER